VVGAELLEERAVEELDIGVVELAEARAGRGGRSGGAAAKDGSGRGGGGGFEEGAARWVHGGFRFRGCRDLLVGRSGGANLSGDFAEGGEDVAELDCGGVGRAESEVGLAVERVELLVGGVGFQLGVEGAVAGAELVLDGFDGGEGFGGEHGEDAGAEAGGDVGGDEDGLAEDVGVDLIEDGIVLGDAAGVDDAVDRNAVLGEALEDDAGVEGGAFDGGEELVLSGVDEVPAEGDAAELGIDEDGAVAVVPGEAEEAGLSGTVAVEAFGEVGDGVAGAGGDGVEDVAGGGEAGFDAGELRMDAAGDDAADAGDEGGLLRHGDDAGGGAHDVNDVAFAAAGADGVPVGVEGTDGDGNAGAEAELCGPLGGEMAGEMVGGAVIALELVANAVEEGIELGEEGLRREAVPFGVPHPLVAHGADAALDEAGIGYAAEGGGDHVAVLEGGGELRALVRVVAEPVEELGESPLVGVDAAAPLDGLEVLLVGEGGDLAGFGLGAVIAPEVVVAEGLHAGIDGDDAGAGGVEGDGGNFIPGDAGSFEGVASGFGEGAHLVRVGLGGEVGVVAFAVERVFAEGRAEASAVGGKDGDADAERAEVDACNNGHGTILVLRGSVNIYPKNRLLLYTLRLGERSGFGGLHSRADLWQDIHGAANGDQNPSRSGWISTQ
jgi:hypothetical protein